MKLGEGDGQEGQTQTRRFFNQEHLELAGLSDTLWGSVFHIGFYGALGRCLRVITVRALGKLRG